MPLKKTILLGFLISTLTVCARPDPAYRFLNFGYKDGLPEKAIYNCTQDKQGYMWFGTATGLYRYDGISFKQIRSSIDKAGNNISNILQSVYTDKTGNLWLGSLTDLQWYDPLKNIFWRSRRSDSITKKLRSSYIVSFSSSVNGDMWIGTSYNRFFGFNRGDSSFTDYNKVFPATASKTTLRVLEINKRRFAVHTEGLYEFFDENKPAVFYPLPFSGEEITSGAVTSEGILLTTFFNGVIQFSTDQNSYAAASRNTAALKKNNVFCVAENSRELWVGSYPLFKCNENGECTAFVNTTGEEYDLDANKIGCLFFDREQNLWICSYNGLSMLPWQNRQVSNAVLKDYQQGTLIEPAGAWSVPGSNNIIISNTSTKGLVVFNSQKKETLIIPNPVEKGPMSRIIGVVQKKDGSLYVSDDKNLFSFNPLNNQMQRVLLNDQYGKPLINAGRNVCDSRGNVFISSIDNGFYKWNAGDGKLFHYDKNAADPAADIKTDNVLYPSCCDKNDNIWFTSNTGIYQLIQSENRWKHFTAEGLKDVPVMTRTQYIAEDRAGHIWITTVTNGLYELYYENGKEVIRNYSKTSGIGLHTDYCIKIKPDKKENILWLSSHLGIHRFDPVAKRILSTSTPQNGLAKEGGGYTFNITDDNRLVILFYGACSIIDLNSYRFNNTPPEVAFNSIKVLNKEMLYAVTDSSLRLSYNQNFLQFEFAAMLFNNSNQFQYAYQLEGADNDWVYGSRNEAAYSGLRPGTYTFKVKAANNDGVWSSNITAVKIVIKNPFWKTAWFIGLCLLLVTAVLFMLYKIRLNSVRKEEKLKAGFTQQIADMEMRALRAQMNPHFIFNSLNSIQKYILKNEHFAASQYLTKFSRLIRLILDHSNQNNIPVSSEIELLRLYCEMESLRFDNRFNYKIDIDPAIQTETAEIPSMLIQPYIENAIWHGLLHKDESGNLIISFHNKPGNVIQVIIEDDGVGRQKAAELKSKQVLKKKSYGMQITEDRIAIINRLNHINASCRVIDLADEAGRAKGTRVVLEIPIKPTGKI